MAEIKHPKTGRHIEGRRLEAGKDRIQKGDKYDAEHGWGTDDNFAGHLVDSKCPRIWVRPGES